jgi:hypothetical protein
MHHPPPPWHGFEQGFFKDGANTRGVAQFATVSAAHICDMLFPISRQKQHYVPYYLSIVLILSL